MNNRYFCYTFGDTKRKKVVCNPQNIIVGEKPYKCNDCARTFAYKCNLKVHQRIHKGLFKINQKNFSTINPFHPA